MQHSLVRLALTLILTLTCFAAVAYSQTPNPMDSKLEAEAHDIYGVVMSPYCPGRLLNDCPSSAAGELKEKIRSELSAGKSSPEILDELEKRFGPSVLALPPLSGFASLAWIAPPLFLGIGVIILFVWLRHQRRQGADESDDENLPL